MAGTSRALVDELYRRMNDLAFEQIRHGLALWTESWGEFRMKPEEVIDDADDVFAMTRYRARGVGSGVEFDTTVAHLFRVREGLVSRWWMFGDADKARRRFVAGERPP